jgi:arylsulfatase A-like enzyme
MKTTNVLVNMLVVAAVAGLAGCGQEAAPPSAAQTAEAVAEVQRAPAPNILLIISDDIGIDVSTGMYRGLVDSMVERYGPSGLNHPNYSAIEGRPASTPRLDALARDSMVFLNTWANPFCSPTRASLLTGLYAGRNRVLTYADPLSQSHTSFVQKLRDEGGYSTAVFGKWHMAGLPSQQANYPGMKPKEAGFDLFKGNMHAALRGYWDYDYQIQDENTAPGEWRTEAAPVRSLPGIAPTNYAEVAKAADTIEWITAREQADPDKPWFAWLAFNLSHATAVQVPSAMAIPNADTLDQAARAEVEACGGEYGTNNTGTCSGEALMRIMTNSMDTIIGKVLDAVDALDPNTYIIFIGDNGTPMYARPNLDHIDNLYITRTGRGKGSAYESGARVPMTIKGPGIAPNSSSSEYVHAVDLFSTSLQLAGLAVPTQVSNNDGTGTLAPDSVSLAPLLFNEAQAVRDPDQGYLLTETVNLMTESTSIVGARNAHYKVVCVTSVEACEFYDLQNDPLEEYALAKPDSCEAYTNGSWNPQNPEWHYCRLTEVVRTESFLGEQ